MMSKHRFDESKRWRYKNRLVNGVWFRVLRLAHRGKQQVHENFVARQYLNTYLPEHRNEIKVI